MWQPRMVNTKDTGLALNGRGLPGGLSCTSLSAAQQQVTEQLLTANQAHLYSTLQTCARKILLRMHINKMAQTCVCTHATFTSNVSIPKYCCNVAATYGQCQGCRFGTEWKRIAWWTLLHRLGHSSTEPGCESLRRLSSHTAN
eukprot:1152339-Pelagomonas_calceolata.AAC.5